MNLKLQHSDSTGRTSEGERIETSKFEDWIKKEEQRPRKVHVAHVLPGCSALGQTKYLYRHNAAINILYFELLRNHKLVESVSP